MESIDKAAAQKITAAVQEALDMVAEDLGLEVKVQGGRYDPHVGTYAPKVEFSVGGAAQREFAQWAEQYGLKAEDYERAFVSRGKTFRIVGVAPRSSRYPIIVERGDGKQFKFEAESVARMLERAS